MSRRDHFKQVLQYTLGNEGSGHKTVVSIVAISHLAQALQCCCLGKRKTLESDGSRGGASLIHKTKTLGCRTRASLDVQ